MTLLRQFALIAPAKKSIALITALLMLVSNAGFALTVHYCEGKLSSVSSGSAKKEVCETPKPEAEKKCCTKKSDSAIQKKAAHKKCCSDKTLVVKSKISDILVKRSFEMASPFLVPIFTAPTFVPSATVKSEILSSYYCDANAPPLFKLHHQYLLYA